MFPYDSVRVISLPERRDRRRTMEKQGFAFEFFDAIRPPDKGPFASIGFHGSYLSHLAVLKEAAGQSVLILEDDCGFSNLSYRIPECDIFYGSHDEDSDEMIGAHCMGFSARAASLAAQYLTGLYEGSIPPDPRAVAEGDFSGILPPIDGAYVWFRRAHPELTTHFHKISYQRASRSDCTPSRLDSVPILRSFVSAGRKVKEAFA